MAAKTLSSPVYDNVGSLNAVTGSCTSVADGDTLASPLSNLQNVICNPTTAVVVTASISGQTITFKVASGTPTVLVTLFGRG